MLTRRHPSLAKLKRAAAPLVPLTLCAALAAHFGLEALATRSFEYRELLEGYVAGGERIIHGVDTVWIIDRLPSACVLAAALFKSALATNAFLTAASIVLLALLAAAVESLLEAPALFGLAPVVCALFCRWEYPQAVACLWLLVIAGFLIRFAQKPNRRRALSLALALGSSFMFRSDLVLLPPALAAAAFLLWKESDKKALAILLLVPYLFTLPVLISNIRLHRRFSPLESVTGAWDDVAKGAIGLVNAGEPPLLEPYADGAGSPFRWAVRQVAGDPARYAAGYLARLGQAATWCSPFLFFALWALWRRRRERGAQALGLLVAYWLAFYCSIAIDERYFEPLMPLLILPACGLAGELALWRPAIKRFPAAALTSALALGLALDAYSAVQLLRGPRATVEEAAQRSPRDWWLLERRGAERLRQGDAAAAGADFASALALLPPESAGSVYGRTLRFERAAAAAFSGDDAAVWRLPVDEAMEFAGTSFETRLLRAFARLRSGRRASAKSELAGARERWEVTCRSVIGCAASSDGFASSVGERLTTA